jgi:hypothetical protein
MPRDGKERRPVSRPPSVPDALALKDFLGSIVIGPDDEGPSLPPERGADE